MSAKEEFLQMLHTTNLEYGCVSELDHLLEKELTEHQFETTRWIHKLYLEHFHDIRVLTGLLRTLAHMDRERVGSATVTALLALRHPNVEVRECAVRAFENWETETSLFILKDVHFEEEWLQDYVSQVVSDLGKKFN